MTVLLSSPVPFVPFAGRGLLSSTFPLKEIILLISMTFGVDLSASEGAFKETVGGVVSKLITATFVV